MLPVADAGVEAAFACGGLQLKAALDTGRGGDEAASMYAAADLVIIAVPAD